MTGETTVTVAISAVDMSKTIVFLSGITTSEPTIDHRGANARVFLSSSTGVSASIGVESGYVLVGYQVIEYY